MPEPRQRITVELPRSLVWDLEALSKENGTSLPLKNWLAEIALPEFVKHETRRQRRRKKQLAAIERERDFAAAHEWALLEDAQRALAEILEDPEPAEPGC